MKLIIDIPDRIHFGIENGFCVNGSDASQIVLDAIKNGTPFDDLKEIYIGMDGNAVQLYPYNEVLDKIRAEIMSKDGLEEALEIIDKYREGEEDHGHPKGYRHRQMV